MSIDTEAAHGVKLAPDVDAFAVITALRRASDHPRYLRTHAAQPEFTSRLRWEPR